MVLQGPCHPFWDAENCLKPYLSIDKAVLDETKTKMYYFGYVEDEKEV